MGHFRRRGWVSFTEVCSRASAEARKIKKAQQISTKSANVTPSSTNSTVSDNDILNGSGSAVEDNTLTSDSEPQHLMKLELPKTKDECVQYFEQLKASENYKWETKKTATKFFEFYGAKGWKINGDQITNWQFLANKWARDEKHTDVPKNEYTPSW